MILIVILPLIIMFLFIFIYRHSLKKKIANYSQEEKENLSNIKKKLSGAKIIAIIVGIAFYLILTLPDIINSITNILEWQSKASKNAFYEIEASSTTIMEFWNIILKLQMFILLAIVVGVCAFKLYIKHTKKLEEKDREFIEKYYSGKTILGIILAFINFVYTNLIYFILNSSIDKPIIYLYPERKEKVKIKLSDKDKLTHTYPKYEDSWKIEAYPDGTLIDENGRKYYALYWEGITKNTVDKDVGFCVKGEDTIGFLEEKLTLLGLNDKEAEEFIIYWLPQLEKNKYNYIYFKQTEEVNELMGLDITPNPDTLIRVIMCFKPLNKKIDVKEQYIVTPERKGFTVVEWGGSKLT